MKAGETRLCARCGMEFKKIKRGQRKYCSEFCRDEVRRERQREAVRKKRAKK